MQAVRPRAAGGGGRIMAMVVAVVVVLGGPAWAEAQDGKHDSAAKAGPGALLKPPPMPKGARQLKPMYIDPRLFAPDKWWKYEGHDDDRPDAYGVEQNGAVSIGGRLQQNHGANVFYRASEFATGAKAHEAMRDRVRRLRGSRGTAGSVAPYRRGDEALLFRRITPDKEGKPAYFASVALVRYGRYVVEIAGASDMKAFGPRPQTGERPWMCEPVFNSVLKAALAKWDRHRALLPEPAGK